MPKVLRSPWPVLQHRSVGLAQQHVDQMLRTEAEAAARCDRCRTSAFAPLACRPRPAAAPGSCRNCRRATAPHRNTPSRRTRRQLHASHSPSIASSLAARAPIALRRAVGLLDHAPLLHDVAQAVDHPCIRRQAVTPGAPGLLVIALDALGQVQMRDKAHVRLVYAHAEGDGRHHDDALFAHETALVQLARARVQAGVVRQRASRPARRARPPCHRPRRATGSRRCLPRPHARRAGTRAAAGAACPSRRCGSGCSAGRSWRRIGARAPSSRRCDDLLARLLIGGGGERDARHAGEAPCEHRQLDVFGTEVVAPLRHAVRLVDGEQRASARARAVPGSAASAAAPAPRTADPVAGAHGRSTCAASCQSQRGIQRLGPHPASSSAATCPASARSAARRRRRAPGAPAPGSGSTGTCRRRWA